MSEPETRQQAVARVRGVMLITTALAKELPAVEAALAEGVAALQLRRKEATTRELLEAASSLQALISRTKSKALLLVNDRVDVALAGKADGVHVGDEDMPAAVARRIMGEGRILGVSCRTAEQAVAGQKAGADYVAVGSIFPSPTKPSAPVVGLERLGEVRRAVEIPICAIGGITVENAAQVKATGADLIAVISAILSASDLADAARALVRIMQD